MTRDPSQRGEPYASPFDHLHDLGVMAALLVRRFIVRRGDRMLGADGRLDDVLVTTNEALAFFQRRLRELPIAKAVADREHTLDNIAAMLAEREAARHLREEASVALGAPPPLRDMVLKFALSGAEEMVLALLAAIEMDVGLRRVARYAMADARAEHLNVGFIHELIANDGAAHDALWRIWSPEAALRRFRLVQIGRTPEDQRAPLFERPISIRPRVAAFLRGETIALDEALDRVAEVSSEAIHMRDLVLADDTLPKLLAHVDERRTRLPAAPRIALTGPLGVGKRSIANALGRSANTATICVDVGALVRQADRGLLALLLAESRLTSAPLYFDLTGLIEEQVAWVDETFRLQREALDQHPHPILFGAHRSPRWLFEHIRGLEEVAVDLPGTERLGAFWDAQLGSVARDFDVDTRHIAATYRLPPGRIVRAAREVLERASSVAHESRRVRNELLWSAARRQLSHRLGTLAEPVSTELSLADVVLAPRIRERIIEILTYAREQRRVFEQWGFGARITYGRGLGVLFSGPPGTGKTFVSSIIAHELGREMFRVDTSRVVDKYIGETEKNLGKIFDEAERAQAVLLFDEADSLFAKRTSVESSNDRYANQNVNFLLQRMEDYSGISILTTNFESSIDEALRRRLRFSVRFPEPSVEERALLWRSLIPSQARRHVDPNIDYHRLATLFDITGGYIKNAVLRAAMMAASHDALLDEDHLAEAAAAICEELGRLVKPR